ncbi:MAG: crossover junction endodeoxyribonuclease RuvC, partial [Fidelibacterota bacterium]
QIGHVKGVIILAAVNSGIPVAEYSATEIKQSIVGNGRASKQQVQYMVMKLLKLKEVPKPHDAADALAVAICHLNKNREFQTKVQMR